jgi:hypothetical protein
MNLLINVNVNNNNNNNVNVYVYFFKDFEDDRLFPLEKFK